MLFAEFINLISSESNEVCSREEKRTIAPEHVLKALEVFGHSYMFLVPFFSRESLCNYPVYMDAYHFMVCIWVLYYLKSKV